MSVGFGSRSVVSRFEVFSIGIYVVSVDFGGRLGRLV